MLLALTSDQEFFRETTGRFLTDLVPVAELRRLRHDPQGFTDDYWRQGAELGWTSLLVGEASGGGSISGEGVIDLTLIAYEFGAQAAPGPLVPTNIVAGALSDQAPDTHAEVLGGLLAGTSVASWCYAEPRPDDRLGDIAFEIRVEGTELVLNGTKRPVESGARADHFLVTGRTGAGLTQVLVPADAPGITIEAMETVDLTRRFSVVRFDQVRVPAGAVVGEVGRGRRPGRAPAPAGRGHGRRRVGGRHAEVVRHHRRVGLRPLLLRPTAGLLPGAQAPVRRHEVLARGQPRHQRRVRRGRGRRARRTPPSWSSVAKAYIGYYGAELIQDCVQIHGGIGVTFEHDIHLYLRRLTVDRALYGTPSDHRRAHRRADDRVARMVA